MSATRAKTVRQELQRIRQGISDFVRDDRSEGRGSREAPVAIQLTIRDVMQTRLATVRPESPLALAVSMMIEQRVSSLPVVDADGRIVGALNEKDTLRVFYEIDATTVESVMTRNPIVSSIDAPLVDIIDHLMSSEFRRVLIHERGQLVGVIVRTDLMPAVLQAVEEVASRQTPSSGTSH
jgi:CBS-domain-containing membrane protein